jgi:alcohol dehydrogenase (cytochrome c)
MSKDVVVHPAGAGVVRSCVLISLVLSSPLVMAQDVEPGRRVFAGRCANCHGTEGAGGELGPSIIARVLLRNDQELETVIREGVPGSGMPAFPTLSRTEATDLVAFLRMLRPRSSVGPRRASVTIAGGRALEGIVLNQSHGELQLLGDDRAVHLLREATRGQYREVTSQSE